MELTVGFVRCMRTKRGANEFPHILTTTMTYSTRFSRIVGGKDFRTKKYESKVSPKQHRLCQHSRTVFETFFFFPLSSVCCFDNFLFYRFTARKTKKRSISFSRHSPVEKTHFGISVSGTVIMEFVHPYLNSFNHRNDVSLGGWGVTAGTVSHRSRSHLRYLEK